MKSKQTKYSGVIYAWMELLIKKLWAWTTSPFEYC